MSRIGKKPIPVPAGVEVKIDDHRITVKGPKGSLEYEHNPDLSVTLNDNVLTVTRASDERRHRALHGLTRSLLANMVTGVSDGYQKTLDLVGVGYRVQQESEAIVLQIGYSHQITVQPLPGLSLVVEGNNRILVQGIDKQVVGEMAAQIKKLRTPNVYTGKGIRYTGEQVRLKPGKSARR